MGNPLRDVAHMRHSHVSHLMSIRHQMYAIPHVTQLAQLHHMLMHM